MRSSFDLPRSSRTFTLLPVILSGLCGRGELPRDPEKGGDRLTLITDSDRRQFAITFRICDSDNVIDANPIVIAIAYRKFPQANTRSRRSPS